MGLCRLSQRPINHVPIGFTWAHWASCSRESRENDESVPLFDHDGAVLMLTVERENEET